MAKARKGDMYAAFNKVMGKAGPTTKLKKQTAAKPAGGGGKGGSSGGGRPKGGSKSSGLKMSKMKSGSRGGSRGGGKGKSKGIGSGRRQRPPKGFGEDARKMQPDSKKAQKMIDQALERENAPPEAERDPNLPTSGPGSEGGRHGLRKARAEADAQRAQNAADGMPQAMPGTPPGTPQDIPPVDESMPAPRGNSPSRDQSIPPAPSYKRPNKSYTSEGYQRSRRGSTEPKQSMSTEEELGMVHDAIIQPTNADIEELMSDPQKHIKLFIDSFGEAAVPPEVWSMLEAPTGAPPPMPPDYQGMPMPTDPYGMAPSPQGMPPDPYGAPQGPPMPMPMPTPRDEDFAPMPPPEPEYPPPEEYTPPRRRGGGYSTY